MNLPHPLDPKFVDFMLFTSVPIVLGILIYEVDAWWLRKVAKVKQARQSAASSGCPKE